MNRIKVVFALACAISPAGAQKVRVDFDHTGNFSNYQTYRWVEPPDVQFFNQLMQERVTGFVEEALAAKHLRRVETGGDLLISLRMRIREQEQFITYADGAGFGWGWGGATFTTTADPILLGTLTVDLVDSRRNQLVFQSVSTESISSKPEKNTKKLAKVVNEMFEKYPPQ
jgi:hypothetical protein